MSKHMLACIALVIFAGSVRAQVPDLTRTHHWPYTQPTAVACRGDTAFVAMGPTLRAYEFSTPTMPTMADQLEFDAPIDDLLIHGHLLHVLTDDGITMLNLAAFPPFATEHVFDFPGYGERRFQTHGDTIFCIEPSGGEIHFLELTGASDPIVLGSVNPMDDVDAAVIAGTRFVCGGGGGSELWVYDIADMSSPSEIGMGMIEGMGPRHLRWHDDLIYSYEGSVLHLYEFVGNDPMPTGTSVVFPASIGCVTVDGSEHLVSGTSYVGILDGTTLSSPWIEGVMGWIVANARDGDQAFAAGVANNTFEAGLHMIDCSDPAAPQRVGTQLLPGDVRKFSLHGDRFIASETRHRLNVYELATGADPAVIAFEPITETVWEIDYEADLVAVSCYTDGLKVATMAPDGSLTFTADISIGGNAMWIDLEPPYLYVTGNNKLTTFDLSDPALPVMTSETITGWSPKWVDAEDGVLIMQDHDDLLVFGLDDRSSPTLESTVALPTTSGLCGDLSDGLAALALSSHGVRFYDVSTPSAPILKASIPVSSHAREVRLSGGRSWIVTSSEGMLVHDIHDATAPSLLGTVDLGSRSYNESDFDGRTLMIGGRECGFSVFRDEAITPIEEEPVSDPSPIPASIIAAAHPNPFNPRVGIDIHVAVPGVVKVTVHDLRGRTVATIFEGPVPSGALPLEWSGETSDGREAPSGVYTLRLHSESGTSSRQVTLAR